MGGRNSGVDCGDLLFGGAVDEETGMNKREQRQLKRILKRRLKEAETEEDRELARAAIARLKSGEADPE